MDAKQKILISGDVCGNFKQLFNRVESINKKTGPFELLLCVGEFFGNNNDELQAYISGNKKISVPTYILGPNVPESAYYYDNLKDGEICTNLTYLGKRGLYTIASGIKIAYLSGVQSKDKEKNEWTFDQDDAVAVRNMCLVNKLGLGDYRGVDILLTSQWPAGMDAKENNTSSKVISWLAAEIKPRYHFCGLADEYLQRDPYRSPTCQNTQLELATRFISLAFVGNKKSRYIMGIELLSVDKMKLTDLLQRSTNETSSPYEKMELMKDSSIKAEIGSAQFFYDTNSFNQSESGAHKRKGLGSHGDPKRQRRVFDQEKCWFCLSSSTVEKHLIVTIGEHFYLALAKGPINEHHFLLLPVTHIASAALLSKESWDELEQFKQSLRDYFKTVGKVVTFFERNYRSSHAQINVVAIKESLEWQIKIALEDKSEEYNLEMETLPKLTEATQLPDKGAYFIAELPNNTTMMTRNMKLFPLHFGREVFCAENVLNCEQNIDWKACQLSTEEETKIVKEFRSDFAPFNFTK